MKRAFLVILMVAACGPSAAETGEMDPSADVDADLSGQGDGAPGDNADDTDARPGVDARPLPENPFVYAHTDSALYRVDPDTLTIELVGPFVGASDVTDIALDKDGNLYAVAFEDIYSVDPETAEATLLTTLDLGLNSLSFVPDPDDPAREILVAADDENGTVLEIDPTDGSTTVIGDYGDDGGELISSGDIVYVKGLGILATVTVDDSTNDYLIRVDPQTFEGTVIGDTGFIDVFGLGFWGDKVFGFTDERQLILIDVDTGVGQEVDAPAERWWGAGVTTRAVVSPE